MATKVKDVRDWSFLDQPTTKAKSLGVGVRSALSAGQPGQWSSDHRGEAGKFTGWNYIAIHALASQAMQADVYVYNDAGTDGERSMAKRLRRKELRKSYGSLTKAYGADDATTPLPESDYLVRLLARPNPRQSGALFRYEQVMQLRLTGCCLIWNVPNK